MELTAIFVNSGGWWAATIEEIPGVNTQGRTIEEARENLQEALQMVLAERRAEAKAATADHEVVRETIHPLAS